MKFLIFLLLNLLPVQAAIFGDIEFGDSYALVQQKLLASELASTDLPETLLGRTGLNGVFETTRKVGNDSFKLFFTFENQKLTQIMLKSAPKTTLNSALDLLEQASTELEKVHGPPVQAGDPPKASQFPLDASTLFRLWHPEGQGTTSLGLNHSKDGFSVLISLQQDIIELRRVPAK